jgi:hypothetical protein
MLNPMDKAPLDGTEITIRTRGGYEFRACFVGGFLDDDGKDVSSWVEAEEGVAPPCWSDGAFWDSNADGLKSDPPIGWKR